MSPSATHTLLHRFQICRNMASGNWDEQWKHIPMRNFNRVIAITALWTLAFCYIPGNCVHGFQIN